MTPLRGKLLRPTVWFIVSFVLYGVFETLNATVVCHSIKLGLITGLFSFLGFWSLVAFLIAIISEMRQTRRFSWWLVVIILQVVALTLADKFFGQTCYL